MKIEVTEPIIQDLIEAHHDMYQVQEYGTKLVERELSSVGLLTDPKMITQTAGVITDLFSEAEFINLVEDIKEAKKMFYYLKVHGMDQKELEHETRNYQVVLAYYITILNRENLSREEKRQATSGLKHAFRHIEFQYNDNLDQMIGVKNSCMEELAITFKEETFIPRGIVRQFTKAKTKRPPNIENVCYRRDQKGVARKIKTA